MKREKRIVACAGLRFCLATFLLVSLLWQPETTVAGEARNIRPGDAIEITVYEHEGLSETVVVKADEAIDDQFIRGVAIEGITIERFREIVVAELSHFMDRSPRVTVRFAESFPIHVTVLGQVENPGTHKVQNIATPLGAIGAAGGFVAGARLAHVKLIRQSSAAGRSQEINFESFYENGDLAYLPPLQEGDIIVVPGSPLSTMVKVLGGVERPGNYEIPFRSSLLDVLFLAGGPKKGAKLTEIKITSPTRKQKGEMTINLEDQIKGGKLSNDFYVEPGDIIFVPEKAGTGRKFRRVMRELVSCGPLD